jgi:peptidoglycan/xylan/chitin deacetylase (PgdA/CDA1 family)
MYHYVRNLTHSRYPEIKGLDFDLFKEQIQYLKKHYTFITMESYIDSIENNTLLPEKSVVLTFDDAYSDHFDYVFPYLDGQKIQGSFYPSVLAIREHKVLDVNKIHFILAGEEDKSKIIAHLKDDLDTYRKEYNLESFSYYYDKLGHPNRFDSADVIFIKRLLQVELDESLRIILTDNLFEKIIRIDESSFSRELYMNIDQLQCMKRNGMHIGSHGNNHYWLGSLSRENQKIEIEKSLEFLTLIGSDIKNWTMCYPYGNYNETTIELLTEYNCKLGLTTEVNIADMQKYNKYTLPRLDTNDIPKDREAVTNDWYLKG